jgi:hypothetical protein
MIGINVFFYIFTKISYTRILYHFFLFDKEPKYFCPRIDVT